MECRVLFDYKAGEEDELDLKKGDLVSEVVSGGELEEGWWSGVSNGKRGVFPNNFVEAVPLVPPALSNSIGHAAPKYPSPQVDPALRTGVNRTQRAKVTFSYKPVNSDELRLEVGDVVEIFAQVEDGWLSGFNKGSRGVFPSNFVEFIEETLPTETPPARDLKNKVPVGGIALPILPMQGGKPSEDLKAKKSPAQAERAKVTFSYEPQEEDELKLEVGDIVEVLNKEHAEGWWEGRLGGRTGVFPNNFVELLEKSVLQKAVLKPSHPARAEAELEPAVPRKASLKAPATAPKRSGPTNELQRKLDRRNLLNTDALPPDNGQPAGPTQAPRPDLCVEEHAPPEEQKAPPRRPSNPKEPIDTRRGPGEVSDTRRAPDTLPDTRRAQVEPLERTRGQGEVSDTKRGQGEVPDMEGVRVELLEVRKELSEARREVTKLKQEYREDFDRISDEAREDRKQLAELKIEVEALKRRRADYWNPEKFF